MRASARVYACTCADATSYNMCIRAHVHVSEIRGRKDRRRQKDRQILSEKTSCLWLLACVRMDV